MLIGYAHIVSKHDISNIPSMAFGYFKSYFDKVFGDEVVIERAQSYNLHKYDIVGISCISQDFNMAKQMAHVVKQVNPNSLVIIGGQHVTWLPETITPDFDIAVRGEGEQTFSEIISYHMNGRRESDLTGIDGISFYRDGQLVNNGPRKLIRPLDLLPLPYREETSEHMAKGACAALFTSRGCPYKCAFCSSSAFWNSIRFHSADYAVSQIEQLVKLGCTRITIMDDLFVADKKRFAQITEKLNSKGLTEGYIIAIQVACDYINDEFIRIMKSFPPLANGEVNFAVESACPRILKLIGKGNTVEENQAAVDRLYEAGIKGGTSWMVGWPGETEEEMMMSFNWITKNIPKLQYGWSFNILMPLPGTKVWNDAVAEGKIDVKNFDWNRLRIWAPQMNFPGWEEWINLRRMNNTLYLNEENVPIEKLYSIISTSKISD
jgi:radical SAM superfamily enzyme YgiQ (UPF0313 family)